MHLSKKDSPGYDRVLLITTVILLALGVVIISSASIMESTMKYGDSLYQTKRHIFGIGIALFCALIATMTPTAFWKKRSLICLFFVLCLMILVLIVGREINGAKRWLNLGVMNLQPAELLKLIWVLYFSDYVSRKIVLVNLCFQSH